MVWITSAATLTQLGIGEAIVTVTNEKGAPTPVAWTRMRASESLMDVSPDPVFDAVMQASSMAAKYSESVNRESATAKLKAKTDAIAQQKAEAQAAEDKAKADREADRQAARSHPSTRSSRRAQSTFVRVANSRVVRDAVRTGVRTGVNALTRWMRGRRHESQPGGWSATR